MTKPTAAMELLTGASAISTAITSIANRGKKFDTDLHIVAVSTLSHAIQHGDITLANKLIAALPKSQRTYALRDWYINFGPFAYDSATKQMTHVKGSNKTLVQAAYDKPFWEFTKEATYVPYTDAKLDKAIINLLKSATAEGSKVSKERIEQLKAIAPAQAVMHVKGIKATRANTASNVKDVLAA